MAPDRRKLISGLPAAFAASFAPIWPALAKEPAPAGPQPQFSDRRLLDPATGRQIWLRLRLPASNERAPLIVYSPGLGSGISNGAAWCEAWQQAGFIVATLAHPGTDDGLWDTSRRSLRANLSDALAYPQYGNRVRDCRFAIEQCLTGLG